MIPIDEDFQTNGASRSSNDYSSAFDSQTLEVIETHISRLYLTEQFVFKQKKRVKFDFLDFTTLDQRRVACEAEVLVNRRLAPDVYKSVVAVRQLSEGQLSIDEGGSVAVAGGGEGNVIDYLVKMIRLPELACLENAIGAGCCEESTVTGIIEMLGRFYAGLEGEPFPNYLESFERHIRDNEMVLVSPEHRLSPTVVARVQSVLHQYLAIHHASLDRRVREGHVVEGHGDLRAEHVYITEPPVCIDAIEFNRAMRVIDVADELAFFSVSCDYLNAQSFGRRVMTECLEHLHDRPEPSLVHFYKAYRATVRAKVAALRTDQTTSNAESFSLHESQRYLSLADDYAKQVVPLRIVVVRGVSGTGKSTVATALAKTLHLHHLSTDLVRQQMDLEKIDRYSQANRDRVYETMLYDASKYLQEGLSVILDGTFLTAVGLKAVVELAQTRDATLLVVTCECDENVAIERIESRAREGGSASEATIETHREQRERIENVEEGVPTIVVDTLQSTSETVGSILASLRSIDQQWASRQGVGLAH